ERRREGAVARRRDAIAPDRNAARLGDLGRDFGRRQDAAMAGLGALAQLDLDHLDLGIDRLPGEAFGVEAPVLVAAAEIAAGDLPDDVAAALAVIGADAAFASVVAEPAQARAIVQGADRIG